MAMPASFSLLLSLTFLTTTSHFSRAFSHPHPHLHQLRASIRQSTSPAANGGAVMPELWCVAMNNANSSALQAALDWACGPGGADCRPIQQGGPCYDAGDILTMASYAFNDYFLTHGLTDESCNFDGTAALTYLNPSHASCKFGNSHQGTNM